MKIATTILAGAGLIALGACSQGTAPSPTATSTASATSTATRIRGAVTATAPTALTVQTYDGQSATVPLDAKTGYAWVVASDLTSLKKGDFIGTATSGPDTAMKALEVVIFPEAMRGTGEGHYGWDTPGVVASAGGGAGATNSMTNGTVSSMTNGTVSSMTNGTVTNNAMTNGTVTHSSMTNGTVAGTTGKPGETHLTVAYKGGTAQVLVPAGTPIVRFEPTTQGMLAKGQKVFAVIPPDTGDKAAAKFVAIGKDNITPPM